MLHSLLQACLLWLICWLYPIIILFSYRCRQELAKGDHSSDTIQLEIFPLNHIYTNNQMLLSIRQILHEFGHH